MKSPPQIRQTILLLALLCLTLTAQAAGTRNFYLHIENQFADNISVTAVGNHRFQGTAGVFTLLPKGTRDFVLQFCNRSSTGWHEGYVRYEFNDAKLGGKGDISVWFDRGGVINAVHYNPGSIPVEIGGSKDVGAAVKVTMSQSIPFKGLPTWVGGPAVDHIYKLTLSPTSKILFTKQTIIIDFLNGPQLTERIESNKTSESESRSSSNTALTLLKASAEYKGMGAEVKASAEQKWSEQIDMEKKRASESSGSKKTNSELKDGMMRIGTISANIVQTADGRVYIQLPDPISPKYFILPDTVASYNASLVGKYCLDTPLDMLPEMKFRDPWGNDSDLKIVENKGMVEKKAVGNANQPSIRPGVYAGTWQDSASITIDKVEDNGTFVGKATLTEGVNKGYVISFEGNLLADKSIVLNRTDQWEGKTIAQKCSALSPKLVDNVYTWKGSGSDTATASTFPFELRISAP